MEKKKTKFQAAANYIEATFYDDTMTKPVKAVFWDNTAERISKFQKGAIIEVTEIAVATYNGTRTLKGTSRTEFKV